jgi:phosphate transport system substrate-binding protein
MRVVSRSGADLIGTDLKNYRVDRKLDAGGQGDVYLATDNKLQRTVVLKVLPPELTVNAANFGRFEREARLASSLDHPNICSIFSFDSVGELHFIAMQYVEGKNVRELVFGRPLELRTVLSIAVQVCDALAAAHARGIIHRDIKANNVMVTPAGQVKILDFGLAKLLDDGSRPVVGDRKNLTEVGIPYGTATYAAPEQAQGLNVDERADIFSTGVLIYEMLTGRWPFDGKSTVDVRYKVVNEPARRLADARPSPTPPKLQEILDKAMAKEPGDRYRKIADMRDELRSILNEISLSSDPAYIEDIALSIPRHLGSGAGQRTVGVLSKWLGPRPVLAIAAAAVFLAAGAMAIWFVTGGSTRSLFGDGDKGVILRFAGSNTIGAKLAPALAEEFFRQMGAKDVATLPGTELDEFRVVGTLPGDALPKFIEIRSHGTATAFSDLFEKKCDIGMASRKIRQDEVEKLRTFGDMTSAASEHIIALDGLAVIVNKKNRIDALKRDQIGKIFTGEVKDWPQLLVPGDHINVYARDERSGTFDSFQTLVLGSGRLTESAKRFEDSSALSNAVARDPNGIGFIGLPYVRDAKAIAVSEGDSIPLFPNRMTVATEDYLFSRRLYLYSPSDPQNQWVRKFVDFVLSKTGQEIVSNAGFIAQNVESIKIAVASTAPPEYQELVKNAERLSLDFRFRKGSKELDNKAQMDLDRVANFLTDAKLSGDNLLLFGFADDGAAARSESELSKERAAAVAEQLKRRGITANVITGFGDFLPVASNATEEGREKNRRVELWLRK